MTGFLQRQIDQASWKKFILGCAGLIGYSYWAFVAPGPWRRIVAVTDALPEIAQGFPADMPRAAFESLQSVLPDYLLFQLIDAPFAFLNAFVIAAGIALALNKLKLSATPLRFLLLLPIMLFAAELVENTLLAMMVSNLLPVVSLTALTQQAATNLKFTAFMLGAPVTLFGVAAAGVASLIAVRKKRAP